LDGQVRVLLAPDKFAGSLTAGQVCAAVSAGLGAELPTVTTTSMPIADGGEGSIDAALAAGFAAVPVVASGPTGAAVRTRYARRGDTALVELAAVCGRAQLPGARPRPMSASTFGVGQVVIAALDAGARQLILAIGGSSSTDGGVGMLQALGARILDAAGRPIERGGAALSTIAAVDLHGLDARLAELELTVARDVDSPLLGPLGAAAVFGPQKGATPAQVLELEAGLRRWADVAAVAWRSDHAATPGAGAAGGTGFAALLLGATMRSGAELMLELVGFEPALARAALVITGEGSIDHQTLAGKAVYAVASAARARSIPVIAVAGRCLLTGKELQALGVRAVYTLTELEPDLARSMQHAESLLRSLGRQIARHEVRPNLDELGD
jgi:glycerate kinase